MVKRPIQMTALCATTLVLLAACARQERFVTYVCDEPLEAYLELARDNIARDYEVDRSRQVLSVCPDKGYHRRYTFSFEPRALASRQSARATVRASWCGEIKARSAAAQLSSSASALSFRFNYPWATSTGKYPPTEFRLNRNGMKGGFFDDMRWSCRLASGDGASG
ncbi:MAG: hypothetical protein V2I82_13150 [Halieaceae bacterium]|nr:hypothetical protein [Halieaceae bacterium]